MLDQYPDLIKFAQGILGPIIGSGIALAGVMYADNRNTKRLLLQQEFAAQESERKRVLELKKEVYLPLGEALSELNEHLLLLASLEEQPSDNPASKFDKEVSRLMMVAETSTAVLANRLAVDYGVSHMKLITLANGAVRARMDAKRYQEFREKGLIQYERVTIDTNKFLKSATIDDRVFGALQRASKRYHDEAQKYWALEIEALNILASQMRSYAQQALSLVNQLAVPTAELLVAVRKELGLDTDKASLLNEMKSSRNRVLHHINQLIDEVERQEKTEKTQALQEEDEHKRS